MTSRELRAFIVAEASPRSTRWRDIGFKEPPVSRWTLAYRIARYLARKPQIAWAFVASFFRRRHE